MLSQSQSQVKFSQFFKISTPTLALGAISIGLINGIAGNPSLLAVLTIGSVTTAIFPYLKYYKQNKVWAKIAFLLVVGMFTFSWLDFWASPAQALFFENAQTFFSSTFTSSTAAIDIVFNTLRALYILYLAVAFIGVFNSVRQDEDWQVAARTPILVVITVTLADLLTDLIIT